MFPAKLDLPLTGLDWLEYYAAYNAYHPALDINSGSGNQDLGNDVVSPATGFVEFVYTGWNHVGFGKFIVIQHSDGNFTRYAHLLDVEVQQGKEVRKGDLIGHVGNSGTTYAHLHFEVFGEKMAEIQKKHWRPWRYYPVGKTKAWVVEHYVNPWEWIKSTEIDEWRVNAEKWASNYIKDMPAFMKSFDAHKWIELIRRSIIDNK